MGAFDDLIPQKQAKPEGGGLFNDLIPDQAKQKSADAQVDDLLPTSLNVAGFNTGIPLSPTVSKALVMLGEGANSIVHGTRQRFNELTGDTRMAQALAQEAEQQRALYQPMRNAHPVASTVLGTMSRVGMTAPLMLLPGGASASVLTRAGNAAVQGAGTGYLESTALDESAISNAAIGGVAGTAASGLLTTLGKAFNAYKGNFKNGARELYTAARQSNVPLTAGEMLNSPSLKKTETLLENLPLVGIGKFRERQAAAVQQAAREAVDRLATQGYDDAGEAIHASLRRVLAGNKAQAKGLYDAVETASMQPGVTAIAPSETRAAATQLLKDYPDIFDRLPAGTVKSKLETVIGATGPKASAVLGPNGKPIIKPAEMTFEEARFLRKQLSNYIDRAVKSAGAVGDDELRQLTALKAGLENDISAWGGQSQNAGVKQAFESANTFYRDKVAPFKDAIINKAAGKDFDTDTIFRAFVKPGRENLAGKLIGNLDTEGHQAVKYGVLRTAYDKALNTSGQGAPFSPKVFAAEIERLGKANNAIFSDVERQQLDGLVKVMSAAQRAGQYMENPPTGNRVVQATLGLGAIPAGVVAPGAVATTGGSAYLMKLLTTSDAGKRFLMAASKVPTPNGMNERAVADVWSLVERGVPALLSLENKNAPRQAAASSVDAYRH